MLVKWNTTQYKSYYQVGENEAVNLDKKMDPIPDDKESPLSKATMYDSTNPSSAVRIAAELTDNIYREKPKVIWSLMSRAHLRNTKLSQGLEAQPL